MATSRLAMELLSEAMAGKANAVNAALEIIDAAVGILNGSNAWTGNNGWYGATPAGAASADQGVVDRLVQLGLLSGPTYPINTNGGLLSAGQARFSGAIGGSGSTAFSLKRTALTFPSDANYTLVSGEADSIVIDVQTGVITATRSIIVPGTVSAFYIVINRNAQSVTLKTASGTGITVASTRAALIYFPGGVNAFRLTADVNYTV